MPRASAIRRDRVTGKHASARSKTGDPACSQAVSAWKTTGLTPAIAAILGRCRAMARNRGKADTQRAAGHEARAQALEHRAKRGLSGKARLERAKALRKERAASANAAETRKMFAFGDPAAARQGIGAEIKKAKAAATRAAKRPPENTMAALMSDHVPASRRPAVLQRADDLLRREARTKAKTARATRRGTSDRLARAKALQVGRLDRDAARYQAAANKVGGGGLGSPHISDVAASMGSGSGKRLEAAKKRMLELHQARKVNLKRNDLPDEHEIPKDRASEVRHPAGGTFHQMRQAAAPPKPDPRSARLARAAAKYGVPAEHRTPEALGRLAKGRQAEVASARQRLQAMRQARVATKPASTSPASAVSRTAPGRGTEARLERAAVLRVNRAFIRAGGDADRRNYLNLVAMRQHLPGDKARQDRTIYLARRADRFTLGTHDGRSAPLTDVEKAAMIHERGLGGGQLYIARKDTDEGPIGPARGTGRKRAGAAVPTSTPAPKANSDRLERARILRAQRSAVAHGENLAGAARTPGDRAAERFYGGAEFKGTNQALRASSDVKKVSAQVGAVYGRKASEVEGHIRALDKLAKGGTARDLIVYRGLSDKVQVGQELSGGYQSASLSARTARGFAGKGGSVLEIRVPKGAEAFQVGSLARSATSEQEIALGRNQRVKIVGKRKSGRKTYYTAEIVGGH